MKFKIIIVISVSAVAIKIPRTLPKNRLIFPSKGTLLNILEACLTSKNNNDLKTR